MGIYLSSPSSEIFTEEGSCRSEKFNLRYAVGEMQGWRKNMEDAHITIADLYQDSSSANSFTSIFKVVEEAATANRPMPISLFGVFDGHGGKEVAKFTKLKYPEVLTSLSSFQAGEYELSLKQSFHKIDELLEDKDYDSMLKTLRALPNPSDDRPSRAEPARNRRAPDAMLLEAIRSAAEKQSLETSSNTSLSSNRAQELMQTHNLGDKKALSTSQAVDLIRSILTNAKMKRPSSSSSGTAQEGNPFASSSQSIFGRSSGDADSEGSGDSKINADETVGLEITETELVLKDMCLGDLFVEGGTDGEAEAETDTVPDSNDESGNGNEDDDESDEEEGAKVRKSPDNSTVMALEDDRIKRADGLQQLEHGDRRPESSSPAAAGEYEPSKSTAAGMVCNLKEHRVMAGCTAIVALVVGDRLFVSNAGDSRGVLCRGRVAIALSEDHKPQQKRELDRIAKAGGYVNIVGRINGNLNLSRSLGDLKYKQNPNLPMSEQMITAEPDVSVTTLQSDDRFFLLACDGVWDCLSNQQACDFVNERLDAGMEPTQIVREICKRCLAQDPKLSAGIGGDNMTCLLVLIDFHNKNASSDT